MEEGVSVFTVNTEKAQKLLPRLPLTLMPVTQQQCLQQGMEYAAAAPKGRDAFWALYREKGFDAVMQKYGKLTLEKKLIYHVIVPVCRNWAFISSPRRSTSKSKTQRSNVGLEAYKPSKADYFWNMSGCLASAMASLLLVIGVTRIMGTEAGGIFRWPFRWGSC